MRKKQLVLTTVTLLFIAAMAGFVLKHSRGMPELHAHSGSYLLGIGIIAAVLILTMVWNVVRDAHIMTLAVSFSLLCTAGISYQYLFEGSTKYIQFFLMGLFVAALSCQAIRRYAELSDRLYFLLAGIIMALLIVNIIFGHGSGESSARLWVNTPLFTFQPGEAVKILLLPLGAYSYRNAKRCSCYCLLTVVCCGLLLKLKDLGNATIIFLIFVFMTYLLFDSRFLSGGLIAAAAFAFSAMVSRIEYARERLKGWFHAMDNPSGQQARMLKAVLFGGVGGGGIENTQYNSDKGTFYIFNFRVYAAETDTAIAGILAVFGVAILAVVILAYTGMILQGANNYAVYPACYLLLVQSAALLFAQIVLNFCGSLDVLPFTGVVAPLVSSGGTAMLCFSCLVGMMAGALQPEIKIRILEGK